MRKKICRQNLNFGAGALLKVQSKPLYMLAVASVRVGRFEKFKRLTCSAWMGEAFGGWFRFGGQLVLAGNLNFN